MLDRSPHPFPKGVWRCRWPSRSNYLMIIVVGCPRSGTFFISRLFAEHGFDVGHETWGRDGTSCWQLAADDDFWRRFDQCPSELRTAHPAVHQVRNPLDVIGSLFTIAESSFDQLSKAMPSAPTNTLHRAMMAWLYWNRLAQRRASYTYRVENIEAEFSELCRRAGFKTTLKPNFTTSKQTNSRPHRAVTWGELEVVDSALTSEIKKQALAYGYSL